MHVVAAGQSGEVFDEQGNRREKNLAGVVRLARFSSLGRAVL